MNERRKFLRGPGVARLNGFEHAHDLAHLVANTLGRFNRKG